MKTSGFTIFTSQGAGQLTYLSQLARVTCEGQNIVSIVAYVAVATHTPTLRHVCAPITCCPSTRKGGEAAADILVIEFYQINVFGIDQITIDIEIFRRRGQLDEAWHDQFDGLVANALGADNAFSTRDGTAPDDQVGVKVLPTLRLTRRGL